MSMNRNVRVPSIPTLPRGDQIAAYDSYLDAQKAVDHLSDEAFPVQHVTIVGTDLRMVERVTGRLTYARVALAGLGSGAWLGVFVGLVLWLFSGPDQPAVPLFAAVAMGAAFGMLLGVVSYALTGGKRDFTSSSQIVASRYALLCAPEHAHAARGLLAGMAGVTAAVPPQTPVQPPVQPPTHQPPTHQPTQPPTQPPSTRDS